MSTSARTTGWTEGARADPDVTQAAPAQVAAGSDLPKAWANRSSMPCTV
jgi:hypothetical protein